MKVFKLILILFPYFVFAQALTNDADSLTVSYIVVKGEPNPITAINLEEVRLLGKLKFNSREERIKYLILKRKTLKVYPYAKLAAERLTDLNNRLKKIEKKRLKKKYAKRVQSYIEGKFSDELKKLTRTEGQILVKLIHRQTGTTTFNLVKELRSGWRAFWFNNTAKIFDISLKKEFNPMEVKEDYYIEDILQRAFQYELLEKQESALSFDYFEIVDKWANKPASKE